MNVKIVEITPDPYLKLVLNKDGGIIIGDSVYLVRPESNIIIPQSKLELYYDAINGKINEDFVTIIPTISHLNPSNIKVKMMSIGDIEPLWLEAYTWYGRQEYLSPEEVGNGRPERVRITVWAETSALYPTAGVSIRGEAYRRCGLWCVDWRKDEISTLTASIQYQESNWMLPNEVGPSSPLGSYFIPQFTTTNQEEVLIFQAGGQLNPITGSHYGFKTLKANFSFKKMSHNPTRIIEIGIANGMLLPEIKNW